MAETQAVEVVGEANSPEWYKARSNGIGASEAAAACGVSKWSTPLELYHRKRGEMPEKEQTDAMRLGHLLEPVIQQEWWRVNQQYYQAIDDKVGMFRSADVPFIMATPDCLLVNADDEPECLETKSVNWRVAKELDDDPSSLPIEWKLQGQQQCYVMGVAVVRFAVLVDGRTLEQFDVHRDEQMIDILKAKESELWERIQNGDPPEVDEDHGSSLKLVKLLHNVVEPGVTVELTKDSVDAVAEYERLGKEIRELQKKREAMQVRFLAEMGDGELAIAGDRVITRSWVKPREVSYTRDGYNVARIRNRKKSEY